MKFISQHYIPIIAFILIGIIFMLTRMFSVEANKEVVSVGNEARVYQVVLIEGGYEPASLTIKAGDMVTFTTTREKPHWPASNLHPAHTIYSAFDPKQPVPNGEAWSFTFSEVGEWQFHDHIRSYFRGTIVVTE